MINKEKKQRIDELIINILEKENLARSLARNAPYSIKDEWDDDIIESEAALVVYECMLKSDDDVEDKKFIKRAIARAKKSLQSRLVSRTRQKTVKGKFYLLEASKTIFSDEYVVPYEQKEFNYYSPCFIFKFFYNNKDEILNTKKEICKNYFEQDVTFFFNKYKEYKTKAYKRALSDAFTTRETIEKRTYKLLKKKYNTDDLKIAETKYNIELIESILESKNIGKEFNKHKNEHILFNLFYDNLSAKSRQEINKKHYSIYSILELKNALKQQLHRLEKKLKNMEMNTTNDK